MESPSKYYREKKCACGCGRVGRFHTYASSACRQRAYRTRKISYTNTKAQTVVQWMNEQFGHDKVNPVIDTLSKITGKKNTVHLIDALEQIVYLTELKIRRENRKDKRL
jgi:hypothetical protein